MKERQSRTPFNVRQRPVNVPTWRTCTFVNKLSGESVNNYWSGETVEIDGKMFWKTVATSKSNPRQPTRTILLSRDSWTIQNQK